MDVQSKMIPVVLTTYNRPKALRRTVESLLKTNVPVKSIVLFIQDDGSEGEALEYLGGRGLSNDIVADLTKGLTPVRGVIIDHPQLPRHGGEPNRARRRSLAWAFGDRRYDDIGESPFRKVYPEGPPFVVTIESDCVFHPNWLPELLDAYHASEGSMGGPIGLDGVEVATWSPYRSRAYQGGEKVESHPPPVRTWAHRPSTGGVCHLITKEWYEKGKELGGWMAWEKRIPEVWALDWPEGCGGWDHAMSEQAKREGKRFGVLIPSLVDHVSGDEGTTSGSGLAGDRAVDFAEEVVR